MRVISVESFEEHCRNYHDQRDAGFEAEYDVRHYWRFTPTMIPSSGIYSVCVLSYLQSLTVAPLAVHDVAQLMCNRPKNRFANIFPCETKHDITSDDGNTVFLALQMMSLVWYSMRSLNWRDQTTSMLHGLM